ncbi:MAG TPA: hypothetical protein DDZ68_15185 [Parvularcula sp.]|nr:hypothetical protein [Parvularcula sp.]HBS33412.1 hypothetical protein [Parvularcula sp.]HBS35306.1 hypothetical protein [Parvularcula sp.]
MTAPIDQFIEAISDAKSTSDLLVRFKAFVAQFGFTWTSYIVLLRAGRKLSAREGARLRGAPEIAPSMYKAGRPLDFDPAIWSALKRFEVFHWFDYENAVGADMRSMFESARARGFIDGIGVPVISAPGDTAFFGLSAPGIRFDVSPKQARILAAVCQATHRRFNELEARPAPQARHVLSFRENEMMRLVCAGDSNAEIAGKLGITVHTVDTMMRRVFRKYDVHSRIEAAILFQADLVEPGTVGPSRRKDRKN